MRLSDSCAERVGRVCGTLESVGETKELVFPWVLNLMSMVKNCGVNDVDSGWYTVTVGQERAVLRPRESEGAV